MFFTLSQENKADINHIISKYNCICLYYWSGCGYCQMMLPTWHKLCKKYAKNQDIIIINIEIERKPLLKAKYRKNIDGYPTIIKYKNGKRIEEFNNKREYKELKKFIQP